MSKSFRPHGLQPTRLLHSWDFPGKSTGVGCHHLLHSNYIKNKIKQMKQFLFRVFLNSTSRWLSGKESACQCRTHGSLVWEDPTCCETTKPIFHNCNLLQFTIFCNASMFLYIFLSLPKILFYLSPLPIWLMLISHLINILLKISPGCAATSGWMQCPFAELPQTLCRAMTVCVTQSGEHW